MVKNTLQGQMVPSSLSQQAIQEIENSDLDSHSQT